MEGICLWHCTNMVQMKENMVQIRGFVSGIAVISFNWRDLSLVLREYGSNWGICPWYCRNMVQMEGFVSGIAGIWFKWRDLPLVLQKYGSNGGICPWYCWNMVKMEGFFLWYCRNVVQIEGFVPGIAEIWFKWRGLSVVSQEYGSNGGICLWYCRNMVQMEGFFLWYCRKMVQMEGFFLWYCRKMVQMEGFASGIAEIWFKWRDLSLVLLEYGSNGWICLWYCRKRE